MSQKFPKTPTRFLVALAQLLLVLEACGDSDDTSSSGTAASTASGIPQLTFDGSTCVYEGPEEVTAGAVAIELVQDVIGEYRAGPQFRKPVPAWLSDMGGQSPAGAGETIRWEASLVAGEYVVTCSSRAGSWWDAANGMTIVNG